MYIAHLARAENELLASALEDKLRFVSREHVRGAVVLLRQLLLPLHHFPGEANDHVVLIGLSVDRDGPECGASDLHGLILVPSLSVRLKTHEGRAIALEISYSHSDSRAMRDTECPHRNQSIANAPAVNNGRQRRKKGAVGCTAAQAVAAALLASAMASTVTASGPRRLRNSENSARC